jgi:hypothetical protein
MFIFIVAHRRTDVRRTQRLKLNKRFSADQKSTFLRMGLRTLQSHKASYLSVADAIDVDYKSNGNCIHDCGTSTKV